MDDIDRLVVDHARSTLQTSMAEMDTLAGKSARLVNLGVATLGGTIAVAGLLADRGLAIDGVAMSLAAAAMSLLAGSLGIFVWAFVGLGRRLRKTTGPELDDLLAQFRAIQEGTREFLDAYLGSLGRAYEANRAAARRVSARQGWGVGVLGLALLVFFGALAYVTGGAILE